MGIRNIRVDEDPLLKKKSRTVEKIDDRIKMILDDMAETMYSAKGLGLAGVQVGILRNLVVIDVGDGLIKLINPQIVSSEGDVLGREGCLSVPGVHGLVTRPLSVKVEALNEDGEEITIEATGMLKKALCHELDHLQGILFTDIAERIIDPSENIDDEMGITYDTDIDFGDEEEDDEEEIEENREL